MKQTNYHLFDFLDFDLDLQKDEALWKAYRPTSVEVVDGEIHIAVPFQKQQLNADMAADTKCEQVTHTLILRAYGSEIIRLFLSTEGRTPSDESEMLAYAPSVKLMPLAATFADDVWSFTDSEGKLRGELNLKEAVIDFWSDLQPAPQPTIDLTIYPDGDQEKPVRLSAYDHFSPPRYDALPLAYATTDGAVDRATLSFECKHDECFAGTGERFTKMDLAGHTFYLKNQDGQGVNNRRAYKNIPFYLSSRM